MQLARMKREGFGEFKRYWRHGCFSSGSDRWCYPTSTLMETSTHEGNGCASPRRAPPTKGPRSSNLVYPTMAIAHEGLASLAVDLHEVGDLLALTNSLVQLQNLVRGSQVTPSQSRRHHSPRSNKWCVDDELLALVLQMIVSPTLNSLSQDLDLVERRFEWKATWGRLEIKIHMVGMEYLDLNTRVGGSLSENVYWKCRYVLMALSTNEEWVEGYI